MAKGGDLFVDSATRIARLARVPEFLIGATVVAVGTTLPELLTSLTAVGKGIALHDPSAMQELTDVAVGNAVGSMVCNIGLILALSFLLRPYEAGGKAFAVKGIFLLACTGVLCAFTCFGGRISSGEGWALIALFCVYIVINVCEAVYKTKKNSRADFSAPATCFKEINGNFSAPALEIPTKKEKPFALVLLFILGAVCVAAGALFTVESVSRICSRHVLGANVINGTLLLGLSAVVAGGLNIDPVTRDYTLWFALALAAALVLPVLIFRRTSRAQGIVLGALYVAAIAFACAL